MSPDDTDYLKETIIRSAQELYYKGVKVHEFPSYLSQPQSRVWIEAWIDEYEMDHKWSTLAEHMMGEDL